MSHRSINFVKKWDVIQNGITKLKRILDGSPDQFRSDEYMELYTTIYNMCTQKQSQENPREVSRVLYNKYREAFEESTNDTVVCSILEKDDEFLLKEFVRRWSNHKTMVRWLSNLFSYLDRFLIKRESLTTLNEVGRSCFLQLYEEVKFRARDAVIALINNEREGEQIDKALLKNVLDIYVEIGIGSMDHYEKDFEASMLQDIGVYYSHMASIWILDYSFPDYMLKVEGCLRKEKDRVSQYLHSSSVPKLVEKVQHELLVAHADLLLEKEHSGCRALLRDNKVHDLSRMYRLYNNIPEGLELVSAIFKQHIIDTGTVLVQKAEDAASNQVLIGEIIELHDKYMAYVDGSFQNRILFNKAMHEAFEIFCDKTVAGSSCAELLASFCDNILKKSGSEKLSDEAIEETLEKVVKLLAYVSDKDLFAAFYRKKLARRLLFDRSANYEHERSMLIRLKQQFGGQFTSKMERMVTDLTLAKENQMSFEDYLLNIKDTHLRIDLSVSVLTTVYWPSYKSSDLKLPAEMARVVEVFKEFYDPKSKNRKLTWVYSLGSCHLIGKFDQKDIELIVSTYQAALLLLFNTSDRLSYNEILTQLNLPHDDLVQLLHSLSCSKYKILTKDPNTNTISETDYFEVNDKFTDRLKRIKISLPPVDPPVDERKKIVEDVDNNRRYVIDAAIVRIMKSDKVLDFQQLVSKCAKQLSHLFKPDMKAIKKRTEHLIERDYLRRDKEKKNVLEYLS